MNNVDAFWICHTYTFVGSSLSPEIQMTRAKNETLMLKKVLSLKGEGEKIFHVMWGEKVKI